MAKQKKADIPVSATTNSLKDRLLKKFSGKSFLMSQTDIYTITDWFDTGSYMLNVQISGKLRGGMPNIGALMVTGEESTGKSFVVDEIIKSAQKKGYLIKKYETEGSGDKSGMIKKKIDVEELIIEPIATVEELTASMIQTLDEVAYGEKLLIALDSIGNLCSKKELEDSTNNNDKRDMTKQQKLRAMFRTIMIKALLKRIPIVMTNHVYDIIGSYFPAVEIYGGKGSKYASSVILILSKSYERVEEKPVKEKAGEEEGGEEKPKGKKAKGEKEDKAKTVKKVIGAIISSTADKNRYAKEKTKIEFGINFKKGIQRYFGMIDLAITAGFITMPVQGWYLVKGSDKQIRRADITVEIIEKLLQDGFERWIESEFEYQSNGDSLELDNSLNEEEAQLIAVEKHNEESCDEDLGDDGISEATI